MSIVYKKPRLESRRLQVPPLFQGQEPNVGLWEEIKRKLLKDSVASKKLPLRKLTLKLFWKKKSRMIPKPVRCPNPWISSQKLGQAEPKICINKKRAQKTRALGWVTEVRTCSKKRVPRATPAVGWTPLPTSKEEFFQGEKVQKVRIRNQIVRSFSLLKNIKKLKIA